MNKHFRSILACVLMLVMFACVGCGDRKGGSGTTPTDASGTYNTRTDYSGIQGYRNWYYLTARDSLDDAEYMIWDEEMCTWRMNDVNCLIEPNIVHPGQLDQVIRAWRAPCKGTVTYTSVIQRRPVSRNGIGQDGCYAFIALDDKTYLDEKIIGPVDISIYNMDGETTVKEGDKIYFVLNCNGNYTFDQTYWEITVEFEAA